KCPLGLGPAIRVQSPAGRPLSPGTGPASLPRFDGPGAVGSSEPIAGSATGQVRHLHAGKTDGSCLDPGPAQGRSPVAPSPAATALGIRVLREEQPPPTLDISELPPTRPCRNGTVPRPGRASVPQPGRSRAAFARTPPARPQRGGDRCPTGRERERAV